MPRTAEIIGGSGGGKRHLDGAGAIARRYPRSNAVVRRRIDTDGESGLMVIAIFLHHRR